MITYLLNLLSPYEEYSYAVLFLILLACGFGLPVPEDITLVLGGITSAYEVTDFWTTVLICMLGVLVGDSTIFFMGRYFGDKILKSKYLSKVINKKHVALVRLNSARYGNYFTFFARFLPGVRTPVFFGMGMFKKKFLYFFLIDGLAALISVPVWIYVGYLFGENIPVLEKHIKKMEHGIYFVIIVIILALVVFHYCKKRVLKKFIK